MDFGYIWTELDFKEGIYRVYKVRSLNYLGIIAFIKISPCEYEIFKTRDDLKLQETLFLFRLAKVLQSNQDFTA